MSTEGQVEVVPTVPSPVEAKPEPICRVGRRLALEHPASTSSLRQCVGEPGEETSQIDGAPLYVPLWLCVHFPWISLEVLGLVDETVAAAVVEETQGRTVLHAVSKAAAVQGLAPGMPLVAAYALSPGLRIKSRDLERERRALSRFAERGLAFTPRVSLDFPRALLLEVRGSLGLFGGMEALVVKLRASWSGSGHRFLCASAPAPLASWLMARSSRERHAATREELRSVLGDLSIDNLDLDASTLERLRKAGIANLQDLWRLPRDGLARRYGTRLLDLSDQAAGYHATPLCHFYLPPRFAETMEFPEEMGRLEHFFPAIESLSRRLTRFLIKRDAAMSDCILRLRHRNAPVTSLHQGVSRPIRDHEHLAHLLRERLERLHLPAPVCAVELSSSTVVPWMPVTSDLFAEQSQDTDDWHELLDQIQARLGPEALRYFSSRADHRPEQAHQWNSGPMESVIAPELRPLWLLPEPCALSCQRLKSIVPESERIESGWWDGTDIRRDYRRAVDRRGAGLWIYRNLRAPGQWYLHGLFG